MEFEICPYTTIIFDLGEVVLTNDWMIKNKAKDKEFYGYYKITPQSFMDARNKYILKLQTGKITEKDYWIYVLSDSGAVTKDPTKAIEIMRKYQKPKPGMFTLLKKLKNDGYVLGVITTSHKEIISWKMDKFRLDNYFELIINTADVGWVKPDPRIYKYALKKLKVIPEETIFIDDTPENVEGAEKLGIKGILFQNAEKLKNQLSELGIL